MSAWGYATESFDAQYWTKYLEEIGLAKEEHYTMRYGFKLIWNWEEVIKNYLIDFKKLNHE